MTQAPPPRAAAAQSPSRPGAARAASPLPGLGPCARVVWVAPWGADGARGTQDAPWATIDHARQQVQDLLPRMTGDVVIVLRGGRHTLSRTLAFTPADSGTRGHRVRYVAAAGETPIITSGVPITGWRQESTPAGGWLWSAALPAVFAALPQPAPRQIYVNGVRASRVRGVWPTGGGTMTATTSGFTVSPNPLAAWRNPQTIEFVYRIQWMEHRLGVAALTGSGITMQDTDSVPWTAARTMFGLGDAPSGPPTFVEHAYELLALGRAGQFWVDSVGGRLYYVPRSAEVLAQASVLAPTLDALVRLEGAANISLEGLTFSEASWLGVNQTGLADGGGNEYLASGAALRAYLAAGPQADFESYITPVPGAVLMAGGCSGVRVQECTFVRLGGSGISCSGDNQDCTVQSCTFSDLSAGALHVAGAGGSQLRGGRIQGCTAQECNVEYSGGDVMNVKGDPATVVRHNLLSTSGYIGLDMRMGGLAEYNVVHDVMQTLSDGGALYSYGPSAGLTFARNWCYGLRSVFPGGAMYDDAFSTNKTWQNNVVALAPPSLMKTFFVNGPSAGPIVLSYNFSDAPTQLLASASYSRFAMNRLTSADAPAPASVVGRAGPAAPPPAQCTPPQGLAVASSDPAHSAVVLSWVAPAFGSPAFYEIYSGDLIVGTTTATTFRFADLAPGVTYVFTVAAADALGGVSVPSAPLLWTAPAQTRPRTTYGSGWE